MIAELRKKPIFWLAVRDCENAFRIFRDSITFDQPFPEFNQRPEGILEGILESVRQTFDKKLLNPTILDASASYLNQLIRGHPFKNGNKRLAILYTHIFLLLNGVDLSAGYLTLYKFALLIAIYSEKVPARKTKLYCRKFIENFAIKSTYP